MRFLLCHDQSRDCGEDHDFNGESETLISAGMEWAAGSHFPLTITSHITGVIRVPLVTTGVALFEMPAEYGGTARFDRGHDAPLSGRQRGDVLTIAVAVAAEHVRHLQLRAAHRCPPSEMLRGCGCDTRRNGTWE